MVSVGSPAHLIAAPAVGPPEAAAAVAAIVDRRKSRRDQAAGVELMARAPRSSIACVYPRQRSRRTVSPIHPPPHVPLGSIARIWYHTRERAGNIRRHNSGLPTSSIVEDSDHEPASSIVSADDPGSRYRSDDGGRDGAARPCGGAAAPGQR